MTIAARAARSLLFCLCCLPICSAAQMQGTLTSNLNLRSGPSADSPRITTLKRQTTVTILKAAKSNGFYQVKTSQNQTGWLWAEKVKLAEISRKLARRGTQFELEPHLIGLAAAACQPDLASCPATGCAAPDSPHGLANQVKQTVPAGTSGAMLTFDDFASLQQQADNLVGEDKELTADDRALLKGLTVSKGPVSESDVVSLLGYLVGVPHPNTGESVNCNLKGETNNDYHIPISNDPSNSDFQGIVVEMIPQSRPPGWNLTNLTQVENNQQLVMITGALFYDNFHRVNGDPSNPLGGQPHRYSLWEVHPIVQFLVCTKSDNSCDPNQAGDWAPLGGGQ
ncbi:MAG TPA: SH3 domain-containing protein [Terriglobales bacterium]|nr:SH3 domain-containing protein [Terriglobales bacterium]